MNIIQIIINAILTLLLPVLFFIACWLYRLFVQRLPEHQIPNLERIARMAVRSARYRHAEKEIAISLARGLFEDFHLPIPSHESLSAAIDAAFFELDRGTK
jgi:hypothetical protein